MDSNKQTTEEQILQAAEKIFLMKGFKNSKTSEIAELAGVNNALINYYFRSKENLFNKVLHSKIGLLAKSIINVVDQNVPFQEVIKNLVETQFDFFKENELLPRFVVGEVLSDPERANIFRDTIIPVILKAAIQLDNRLQKEIAAGHVRNISMFDLLYTVTSVNVLCFVLSPMIMGVGVNPVTEPFAQVMDDRKNKNVEIVMCYLNPVN